MKINGADPDFHRRDLWDAIEAGDFPEWELGLQLFGAETAALLPFDALDPTKLITEELVPIRRVGRLVLDRNVKNSFAETEQVAFGTQNIVPGIEFSNDPLAAGAQFLVSRYAGETARQPELRAAADQRAAVPVPALPAGRHMAMFNPSGRVNYEPNSWLAGRVAGEAPSGGFVSYGEDSSGTKVRARPESFADHYNQARQFYVSQTPLERQHIAAALVFELSKVETRAIRSRVVAHLLNVDDKLAMNVAEGLRLDALPAAATRVVPPRARSAGVAGAQHHAQPPADVQRPQARRARDRRRRRRLPAAARDGVQRGRRHRGAHRACDRRRQDRGRRLGRGQADARDGALRCCSTPSRSSSRRRRAKRSRRTCWRARSSPMRSRIANSSPTRRTRGRCSSARSPAAPLDAGCKQVETAMAAAHVRRTVRAAALLGSRAGARAMKGSSRHFASGAASRRVGCDRQLEPAVVVRGHPPAVAELAPPPGVAGEPARAGRALAQGDACGARRRASSPHAVRRGHGPHGARAYPRRSRSMRWRADARDHAGARRRRPRAPGSTSRCSASSTCSARRCTSGWPALRPSAASLRTRLPSDGTYHVLVQTDGARRRPVSLDARARRGAAVPGRGRARGCDPQPVRRVARRGAAPPRGRRHLRASG